MIKAHNQYEIADILKISQPTVSKDINHLREQARQNMQTHLQNRLPEEYENCMAGINQVLKMSWEIATRGQVSDCSNSSNKSHDDKALSSTVDDKTRLQALALASDCYKYKMDLATNGVIITDTIKFVQQKKEELRKINDQNITAASEKEENVDSNDKSNTINKIF